MRLVHKTYEDAKGYLVTEKVWEPSVETIPAVLDDRNSSPNNCNYSPCVLPSCNRDVMVTEEDSSRLDSGHTQAAVHKDCDQQSLGMDNVYGFYTDSN